MKRTVRNYIIRIAIIAVFTAALILAASRLRPSWAESSEQKAGEVTQSNDLTLWYYDEDLTPYVKQLQEDYFRNAGLRVGCELTSVVSFFENINQKNVAGSGAPDLYIIDSTRLEQAYLGSVAKPNAYPELYTLQNYSVKSLTSILYGGKQVAYPLCFDMEFFVYNKDFMDTAPSTFSQLSMMTENFVKQPESSLDMVILYDPQDLLFNYHFISNSLLLGGEAGDDDSNIVLNADELLADLTSYQDFISRTGISFSTTTYDLAENSFIYGRSMCALLKCGSLKKLNQEHTNYAVCEMPMVNATTPSTALSNTFCVCVNPMSKRVSDAEQLAKYMTYDNTAGIYDETGFMSCRRTDYTENGFADVYSLYDYSVSLPKFIETEEVWRDMKKMLNSVAQKGDPAQAAADFQLAFYALLSTRSDQESR